MQNHVQPLSSTVRKAAYIIVASVLGICVGLLVSLTLGHDQVINQLENHEKFNEEVRKNKYNESVLVHLSKLENETEPVEPQSIATVTAYSCGGIETEAQRLMNCPNGITATGTVPRPYVTVACDRANLGRVFELAGVGSVICEDTGGAIKGAGRFDLYVENIAVAREWGVRQVPYKLIK